jgi:hypothetical protein
VGTAAVINLTGAGTQLRFVQPLEGVRWLRLEAAGTLQTAARTILLYGRP